MHLSAGLTAASWIMEPFGEIGAVFSLQLSSRTQFAKISNKMAKAIIVIYRVHETVLNLNHLS